MSTEESTQTEPRSETVHVRVSKSTLAAITIMAKRERRSVSSWASNALEDSAKTKVGIILKAKEAK